jgi:hypothetical protein
MPTPARAALTWHYGEVASNADDICLHLMAVSPAEHPELHFPASLNTAATHSAIHLIVFVSLHGNDLVAHMINGVRQCPFD